MMLSKSAKFLYLGIPKTGTHSVVRLLRQHPQFRAQSVGAYHGSSWKIPADYVAWGTVRNPYTRLLSWWHAWTSRKIAKHNFPPRDITLVKFIHFLVDWRDGRDMPEDRRDMRWPQHLFMEQQPWRYFVRLEHFPADFAALPFGLPRVKLGMSNKGAWRKRGRVASYYGKPELEAAVRYGVPQECETFGYPHDVGEAR